MAGTSGKTVVEKLGIKPGFCIFTAGAPGAYEDIVGKLPAGVTIAAALKAPLDMVHVFAMQASGLAARLRSARDAIAPAGMVWPILISVGVTPRISTALEEAGHANHASAPMTPMSMTPMPVKIGRAHV